MSPLRSSSLKQSQVAQCGTRFELAMSARRSPDAAIDDELARTFGDVGIEIVHEHAQGRFGQPALGAEFGSVGRADDAHIVDAGWRGHGPRSFHARRPTVIARSAATKQAR